MPVIILMSSYSWYSFHQEILLGLPPNMDRVQVQPVSTTSIAPILGCGKASTWSPWLSTCSTAARLSQAASVILLMSSDMTCLLKSQLRVKAKVLRIRGMIRIFPHVVTFVNPSPPPSHLLCSCHLLGIPPSPNRQALPHSGLLDLAIPQRAPPLASHPSNICSQWNFSCFSLLFLSHCVWHSFPLHFYLLYLYQGM